MSKADLIKARKLIALAVCPGAGVEEARSAAIAAVRLIDQHKLLDAPSTVVEVKSPPRKRGPRKKPEPSRATANPAPTKSPAGPRSPGELQQVAWRTVERFVTYLRGRAASGEFPGVTVENLADKAVRSLEVHVSNAFEFQRYLGLALAKKAKDGDLNETMRGTVPVYSLGDIWRTF